MSTRPAALSQSTLTAGRRHDHAGFIAAAWQKSIEAIIETGRRLIDARKELAHGEFLAMIKNDLPFGEDTAERLIKIARDPRLSNSAHGRILPPSWRTLFELTKLNDEQFDRLVAASKNALARLENKNTAGRLNPASHDPTRATAVLSALRAVRFPARFQENLGPEKANYRALARWAGDGVWSTKEGCPSVSPIPPLRQLAAIWRLDMPP